VFLINSHPAVLWLWSVDFWVKLFNPVRLGKVSVSNHGKNEVQAHLGLCDPMKRALPQWVKSNDVTHLYTCTSEYFSCIVSTSS